jgi:hypothetical protein
MTIASTTNRVSYTGTGALITFAYTFKIFVNTDLQVYVNSVLQTLTTDYTVSGVGADGGGNVTFNVAPANGAVVLIVRLEPFTQNSDLPSNDKFPTVTVEDALDKLTMLTQQLNEVDGRALKLAITSLFANMTLPDPVAAKFLRWKTDLSGLENADVTGTGVIGIPVSVAQGGTGSTTAPAAITALGAAKQLTAQSVAYAATIQYDLSTGDFFETTLTGNLTLGTPLNPVDGQRILIRLRQDGVGSRTLAFGGVWRFGTDLPSVTLTTTINKTDYLGAVYHGGDTKWDVIAFIKGF